jgi:hypothetical protein
VNSAAPAIVHAPLLMSLDLRKPTGYRASPDRHARLADEARRRGWSLQRFLDFVLDQFLELEFLDAPNREFLRQTAAALGRPFTPLDILNGCVSYVRRRLAAGKCVTGFYAKQGNFAELFGAGRSK